MSNAAGSLHLGHDSLPSKDILHKSILLVFFELDPVSGHHACRVLTPVLEHEEALVELHVDGSIVLEDANDSAHLRGRPDGKKGGGRRRVRQGSNGHC